MIATGVEPRAGGSLSDAQQPLVTSFFLNVRLKLGNASVSLLQFDQPLSSQRLRRLRPRHLGFASLSPTIPRCPTLRRKLPRLFEFRLHPVVLLLPIVAPKAERAG